METRAPGYSTTHLPENREEKFRSTEDELVYLRARIEEKEKELGALRNSFEGERVAKREIREYADTPVSQVLHDAVITPEHDVVREALKLKPEEHDKQIDGLLRLVAEKGIRNALTVVARMQNPHLEDDFHRALVRYVAEGLPVATSSVAQLMESGETWRAVHMALYEVQPQGSVSREDGQRGLEQLLKSTEQLYAGLLAIASGSKDSRQNVFSLEIAVPQGAEDAIFYIAVPAKKKDLFERHVLSIFPNVRLSECREDYNVFLPTGHHLAAYGTYHEHPILPIHTYDEFQHDPMNVILSAFAKLKKHGEGAALQIVVGNEDDRYSGYYRKILKEMHKGKTYKEALRTPETALGDAAKDFSKALMGAFGKQDDKSPEPSADQERSERVQKKTQSRIVPVNVRIVASAESHERAEDVLHNLASAFNQFEDPHGNRIEFEEARGSVLKGLLHNFVMRIPEKARVLPMNFAEITTIYHLTAEGVTSSRELKSSRSKQAPAPVDMPESGIVLGVNRFGGSETTVHFDDDDRMRHFYLVGQTGTGKSTLLKNMIIQDIRRGEGVCFIDPHGSDIQDVLAAVPPEREKDLIYFDPGNIARPMGLNMLEYDQNNPVEKTFLVDELFGIFQKLYGHVDGAVGPAFEQYFRNATLLVMESPELGNTMVDITRVFASESFRKQKLERCKNPLVKQFWEEIASKTEGEHSLANFAQYVTNKFDVFLANEIMRPIIAQEQSAFDFREIMDNKKILLVSLSKGRIGEINSSLLGLIIVGKFLNAAFSRVDMVGVSELKPFYMYIDEFQNFTTPSIATIFSEARKYRLILNVAHQYLDQLTEEIKSSVFGNVGTRCVFRVGEKDAAFFEPMLQPEFKAADVMNLDNYNGILSLLVRGKPAKPFTIASLKPDEVDLSRLNYLKEQSYQKYGRVREEVEAEINARYQSKPLQPQALSRDPFAGF